MKKFKEFLENYDFYLDKPYGWKKKKKKNDAGIEIKTEDDVAREEIANEVRM